ncbi:MAG: hypothetical protein IKS84_02560, partial [Lachnospiraceae bacterium]|nr:hypothetical protein [Lachnospiraceae bacterium]
MRRRVFALFLAGTMLVSAGCSATVSMDEKGTVTVDDIRYTYDESEYTGGRPWLDTCIKENVSKDMETSPKDDFYLYVNHDWACCTEIMEGESRATVFDALDSAVLEKALSLLKDDTLDGHDASLAQGYFNAFLDWDARNEAGIEPVRDTVKRIRDIRTIEDLNGFILDSDNSWGVPVFMIIENAPNLKDAQNYITEIVHGNFLLEDAAEYTDRTAYGDIMYESGLKIAEAMLTRLGYSGQDAREMFDRAIGLEGELAEVSFTVEDEYQPWYYEKTYNVYEAGSLDELSPVFPLADLLKSRGYGEAELICIDEPEAIVKLNEIYTEDNLEVIKDYMLVGYLIKCSKILDREAYDVHCESENIKKGTTGRMSDEEAAYGCMMERFFVPMDRLYLSVYDASELKTRITEICEQTITAYKEMLEDEDWLTEETRNNAIEKLDNITINAVYPDCWDDYSGLDLSGLGYYDCVKASEQYMDRLDSENAGRKINKKIWNKYSDILKSNAFYYPYDNSVTITLGLCGKPVYYNGMSDEEL